MSKTPIEMKEKFVANLLDKRILYLEENITNDTAIKAGKAIVWLNSLDSSREIKIYIDSAGGEIEAGLDIYDIMRHSQAPITGIVYRKANSMAAVILQACKIRKIFQNSHIVVHNIIIGRRPLDDWRKNKEGIIAEMEKQQQIIYDIFVARTGKNIEEIKKAFDEAKILNSSEAKNLNMVDEII